MGAFEFEDVLPDVTPPVVRGATITNQTTLVVNFSEAIDQNSAENTSNYSIDNGISVSNALLSADSNHVILTTTAHNFNEQYIVTVNNVTDLAGNVVNPQANTAGYLLQGDTTSPEVTDAELSNATTLMVNFSEAIEQTSAENISHYSINNGITINDAVLSTDGKKVTLTTTPHTSGQDYILTVNNVTDLAGNIIAS